MGSYIENDKNVFSEISYTDKRCFERVKVNCLTLILPKIPFHFYILYKHMLQTIYNPILTVQL